MMYFTRYFHYLRNPYPQNDHYLQFHYTRIKSPQSIAVSYIVSYRMLYCDFCHLSRFVQPPFLSPMTKKSPFIILFLQNGNYISYRIYFFKRSKIRRLKKNVLLCIQYSLKRNTTSKFRRTGHRWQWFISDLMDPISLCTDELRSSCPRHDDCRSLTGWARVTSPSVTVQRRSCRDPTALRIDRAASSLLD